MGSSRNMQDRHQHQRRVKEESEQQQKIYIFVSNENNGWKGAFLYIMRSYACMCILANILCIHKTEKKNYDNNNVCVRTQAVLIIHGTYVGYVCVCVWNVPAST